MRAAYVGVGPERDATHRSFWVAIVASLFVHALILLVLPGLFPLAKKQRAAPPIVARLVEPVSPPKALPPELPQPKVEPRPEPPRRHVPELKSKSPPAL